MSRWRQKSDDKRQDEEKRPSRQKAGTPRRPQWPAHLRRFPKKGRSARQPICFQL